jgi:hypothetical protein
MVGAMVTAAIVVEAVVGVVVAVQRSPTLQQLLL